MLDRETQPRTTDARTPIPGRGERGRGVAVAVPLLLLCVVALGLAGGSAAAADSTTTEATLATNNSTYANWEDPECQRCHRSLSTDPVPRDLENAVENQPDHAFDLDHGPDMWCLDCHGAADRNTLRFSNGTVVEWTPENEVTQCAGCHGPVYEDWQNQVHGKWGGSWEDPKPQQTCTGCHDPHDPSFHTIEPEAPPEEPPTGPAVAQAVLPAGYYVSVGFVGILATGLFGFAGLSLRGDRRE